MFGYIILRDIPKYSAQLDLSIFEIQGGFRGFAEVMPGLHHVSVEMDGEMLDGFWCFVEPSGVIIKVFNYEARTFEDPDPDSNEQYTMMAKSGTMNRALIPVMQRDMDFANKWLDLVSYITKDDFPVVLHHEKPMMPPENLSWEESSEYYSKEFKSRFEQAFYGTHDGNIQKFFAEFQFAFVSSLVKKMDIDPLGRWANLLQALYNAGERCIKKEPKFFASLVDVLISQFKLLPDEIFQQENRITYKVSYLIEDIIDADISDLQEKAGNLKDYLSSRGLNI